MEVIPDGELCHVGWISALVAAFQRFPGDRGRTVWALLGGLERVCAELAALGLAPSSMSVLARILVQGVASSFPSNLLPAQVLPEHQARGAAAAC